MATTLVPSAFSLQPSALLLCIENAQQLNNKTEIDVSQLKHIKRLSESHKLFAEPVANRKQKDFFLIG